jgi:hypothetical protein
MFYDLVALAHSFNSLNPVAVSLWFLQHTLFIELTCNLTSYCRWHELQGALDMYRGRLAGALEVHAFNRDVDDTSQRVAEKAVAMNTDDVGRDLAAVAQLQRKQETLERDMTAIEGKLKVHLVRVSEFHFKLGLTL